MRLQSTQANCGPACLRNALLCHGIIRSEVELEQLCGTTGTDGTPPAGLLKGLRAVAVEHPALSPGVLYEARADVALLKLIATLQAGHVAILLVDENEHYVLAFGLLGAGAKIIIHVCDPAENEMVVHLTPPELLARWKGPGRKPFYGVIV